MIHTFLYNEKRIKGCCCKKKQTDNIHIHIPGRLPQQCKPLNPSNPPPPHLLPKPVTLVGLYADTRNQGAASPVNPFQANHK